MRVGITGVTGLIGKKLAALCRERGHSVTGFSRSPHGSLPDCDHLRQFSLLQPVNVSGLDAVIHLAGEPIIGLWTNEKRRRIVSSRRDTTRHLVQSFGLAKARPAAFLCASGTGFYGDRGVEKLTEESGRGGGFLAEVAQVWEEEARAASALGIRCCQMRTGMVLAQEGGAFPLLRRVFSLGLGGTIGNGHQYLPWIHLDDIAALFLHALENESLSGAINAAAPDECTNLAFTRALAAALDRPAWFPVPAFFLSAALGDLSRLVLDSQRVVPSKATGSGFLFQHPELASTFASLTAD